MAKIFGPSPQNPNDGSSSDGSSSDGSSSDGSGRTRADFSEARIADFSDRRFFRGSHRRFGRISMPAKKKPLPKKISARIMPEFRPDFEFTNFYFFFSFSKTASVDQNWRARNLSTRIGAHEIHLQMYISGLEKFSNFFQN